MNSENEFPLSWDGLVKGTSVGLFVLLVALVLIFGVVLGDLRATVGMLSLFACILLMPLLWAPQSYSLDGNVVTVRRRIGEVKIHVAEAPERWNGRGWGLRLFGSGGLYGYFGYFYVRAIGSVHMYATNRHTMVLLVDEEGRKSVVSPNEPDRLIQRLKK